MYRIIGGDKKEYGPATAEEMRLWIAEGRLSDQSQVWEEGSSEWRPLANFPEFGDALRDQIVHTPAVAGPTPPLDVQAWSAQILKRQPRLEIGLCLTRSWNLLMANFGLLLTATLLIWAAGLVSLVGNFMVAYVGFVPGVVVGSVVELIFWIIRGALYGGLYLVFLKRIRGQPASIGDVFSGFRTGFAHLALAGVVSSFLSSLGICCLAPWIYLLVAWLFSVPLVADKRMEFWSAMELSRKVVTPVWMQVCWLTIQAFLPFIAVYLFIQVAMSSVPHDSLASTPPDLARIIELITQTTKASLPYLVVLKLVLLLNLPFALGALMYAYEDLFGPRTSSGS
jgi:hypothetical protein